MQEHSATDFLIAELSQTSPSDCSRNVSNDPREISQHLMDSSLINSLG